MSYVETILVGKAASFTYNIEVKSAAESFRCESCDSLDPTLFSIGYAGF